jgi:hypothetical protein
MEEKILINIFSVFKMLNNYQFLFLLLVSCCEKKQSNLAWLYRFANDLFTVSQNNISIFRLFLLTFQPSCPEYWLSWLGLIETGTQNQTIRF